MVNALESMPVEEQVRNLKRVQKNAPTFMAESIAITPEMVDFYEKHRYVRDRNQRMGNIKLTQMKMVNGEYKFSIAQIVICGFKQGRKTIIWVMDKRHMLRAINNIHKDHPWFHPVISVKTIQVKSEEEADEIYAAIDAAVVKSPGDKSFALRINEELSCNKTLGGKVWSSLSAIPNPKQFDRAQGVGKLFKFCKDFVNENRLTMIKTLQIINTERTDQARFHSKGFLCFSFIVMCLSQTQKDSKEAERWLKGVMNKTDKDLRNSDPRTFASKYIRDRDFRTNGKEQFVMLMELYNAFREGIRLEGDYFSFFESLENNHKFDKEFMVQITGVDHEEYQQALLARYGIL